MKISNFRGDLADISAKKEALDDTTMGGFCQVKAILHDSSCLLCSRCQSLIHGDVAGHSFGQGCECCCPEGRHDCVACVIMSTIAMVFKIKDFFGDTLTQKIFS